MKWLRLVLLLCLAGLMTACSGAGNFGSTGSGSNPGGGGSGSNPGGGGSGSAPAASLSEVGFPNTQTGTTSAALAAVLSNTGTAALNNIVPSILRGYTNPFALTTGDNACGSTLAAGSSCSIYVTFTPTSATSFQATLSVADDASGSPQTAVLGGTGINPCGSSTSANPCCDNTIEWGGNLNGVSASGASAFLPTGAMYQPRAAHTATLLPDGTVLIVDGGQEDLDDLLVSIPSAEIFDPSQGRFSSIGPPCIARELHTATLLMNGKVLITGGNEFNGYPTWLPATQTAELYDPASRSFAITGPMQAARTEHTATLLADGRVLIAGSSTSVEALASTEIYDPTAGSFVAAASLASPRSNHTATMLSSGKVLIVGGENGEVALASAELYDPTTNTFSSTGSMTTPRTGHTATLLANGKVLIAGGASSPAFGLGQMYINVASLPTAELYDPVTGEFSPTGTMTISRIAHTATLLPNGSILIAGGYVGYVASPIYVGLESLKSAEIYNPVSGSFSSTDPMLATRFWHSATLLQDGSVLIAGGIGADLPLASAEIYK
jgi:hypothetical protein